MHFGFGGTQVLVGEKYLQARSVYFGFGGTWLLVDSALVCHMQTADRLDSDPAIEGLLVSGLIWRACDVVLGQYALAYGV